MIKEEFKKLKVGDLLEWNNTVTTNTNPFGVVTQSNHSFQSANTQTMKFHQVLIKWSNHDDICIYHEFDSHTLQLLTLIAKAKR